MKKLAFILLAAAAFLTALAWQQKPTEKAPPQNPQAGFDAGWKTIDSLAKKGLYKSAGGAVENLYTKTRKEGNMPQVVKAALYRSRYQSMEGDSGFIAVINDLERDCAEITFPARPVLHSILAEVYWRYYEQNRYRFLGRSETTGIVETDIRTWDLKKILQKTVEHYSLSLEPAEALQQFPVDVFDLVITDGSLHSRELRPLLYDFLAHRAADFFMNEEAGLSLGESVFDMNNKSFFVNASDFVKIPLVSPDTLDFKYRAMKILQELTRIHLPSRNLDPLLDVEVKRLRFVHAHATVDQQDTIYLAALRNMAQHAKFPESTLALYEMAQLYEQYGYQYNQGADPTKKDFLRKAEAVCNQAIERFPYSEGGLKCKELKSRLLQKSLSVIPAMAYMPGENLKLWLEYRNIQKVFVKLVQNTSDDGMEQDRMDDEKKLKRFLKMRTLKDWSLALATDDDRQQHSTEFMTDSLPTGSYAVLVATSDNFSRDKQAVAVAEFFVSDLSHLTRTVPDGQLEVQVFRRSSGVSLPGVVVNTWISGYDYTSRKYLSRKGATYTTETEGRAFLPALANYQNLRLEFVHGKDRLFTREDFYQHPVQPEGREFSDQTFFFTDRSIYRPGQTVFFKGLALERNGEENRIKKNQKSTVRLTDANGQLVSEVNLTTNEFGTFHGSFTTPQGGLTGQMYISNESGSAGISVEEYKRPKFEVTFEPVTGSFRLGDEIRMTGKAQTYSGAAVDNAGIRYKVTRRMKWIPWPFWKSSISPAAQEVLLMQGRAVTDASGRFTVTFEARPDFSIAAGTDPTFIYTVTADVTDLNGETRSGQHSVEVSYNAIRLSINVPEFLQKENASSWILAAENSAGQREPVSGEIIVSRLQQPANPLRKSLWANPDKPILSVQDYEKFFPLDERNNADPMKWKKGKEAFRSKFDLSKDSVFRPAVQDWASGYYLLEVHSLNKYGESVKIIRPFVLFSSSEENTPVVLPLWVKPVRSNAEPGSADSIVVATGENELVVLYELEHKDKIIKREWITLKQEQKTIVIPVEEAYRGNFAAHFTAVKNNRTYQEEIILTVPWTNKELDISLQTFRNKAEPGSKEEWNLTISGKQGDKVASELLASMYDASLDAFLPHSWGFDIYPQYSPRFRFRQHAFGNGYASLFSKDWNTAAPFTERTYDALNWFGFHGGYRGGRDYEIQAVATGASDASDNARPAAAPMKKAKAEEVQDTAASGPAKTASAVKPQLIKARSNFNETAFFYPQLRTNEKGEVVFSFTLPDALTRWKAQFFAHTQDLAFGLKTLELITQKELMVFSNPPRFVREGDTLELPVKVTSLSATEQQVTASIEFKDALTGKDVTEALLGKRDRSATFSVAAGQSSVVAWKIAVPRTLQAVSYTVSAKATSHSDAETMTFPVLPDRMLITETLPFSLRPMQSKDVTFARMKENTSTTLQHHNLAFEYTGNPAWYAVQALPYLMEYPYECSEQVFARYYANTLAAHVANSSPTIKSVFEQWKQGGKESLLSNLEKNQELKNILLEESPWVRDAANEKEQRQRIALLFDLNKMSSERQSALKKLAEQQSSNGAWPWFQGMPENRYITQYIVEGLGHLDHLKVADVRKDARVYGMVTRAVAYCDQRLAEDYKELQRRKADLSKRNISAFEIHFLYARSFFPEITMSADARKAGQYYSGQAKKFWLDFDLSLQAMIALALSRQQDAVTPGDILKSLRERAKNSEEMGMYWPSNESGFRWSQAPVETQSVLIEAFTELGKNKSEVDDMKLWLLKNKQTNSWKTTKATAEACYALLLSGSDWLSSQNPPQVTVGSVKVEAKAEAGTGYFKQSWTGPEITADMANVRVKNENNNPAWGALYWQYFEDMDKITSDGMPLRIARKIFVERVSGKNTVAELITDTTILRPGDRIKMRVIIQADRDMEYVHVKDLRAAGFEPENVLSGYRYQDGLGYYESTRDAATNFFIGFLPKGMYVFEYPVRAAQRGSYSNGVATIQCMYAPEFSAHSEGFRVTIAGEK